MTDWRTLMREAVERDEEDHLTSEEARSMRRTVVAAASGARRLSSAAARARRSILIATAAGIAGVALVAGLRPDLTNRGDDANVNAQAVQAGSVDLANRPNLDQPHRQLQFLTPGGTRIIWVFNQQLQLEASVR